MTDADIEYAARIILEAKEAVAFTGAGLSTPSGIPDFRSPASGLWESVDPFEVASIVGFKKCPSAFYNWIRPLARTMYAASPNAAHIALAQLEEAGYIKSLVTQNIDMLHTRAGSHQVFEVHGHMRTVTCMTCYKEFEAETVMHDFFENGEVPRCTCGERSVLKPNVILFGEQLPALVFQAARRALQHADAVLVAGSSLEVAPAGDLPLMAKRNGARLIIVNYSPTHADSAADVVLRGDVAAILPRIAAAVMRGAARASATR